MDFPWMWGFSSHIFEGFTKDLQRIFFSLTKDFLWISAPRSREFTIVPPWFVIKNNFKYTNTMMLKKKIPIAKKDENKKVKTQKSLSRKATIGNGYWVLIVENHCSCTHYQNNPYRPTYKSFYFDCILHRSSHNLH